MTQPDWSAELAQRVGQEVRKHRDRQKISAQQLADRCAQLGLPIERSVLAGLENRRRSKISLAEVLILAMALDVAPIVLIFPVGDVEAVEVLPDKTSSPFAAAKWFSGYEYWEPSEHEEVFYPRDWWNYIDSIEKLNAYRQHDNLVDRMEMVYEEVHPKPRSSAAPKRRELTPEEIAHRTDVLARYGGLLHERRNDMRGKDMLLPPVPDELVEYLIGPTAREQLERWDVRTRNQIRDGASDNNEADRD